MINIVFIVFDSLNTMGFQNNVSKNKHYLFECQIFKVLVEINAETLQSLRWSLAAHSTFGQSAS
jgi:hypothetical protein